MPPQFLFDLSGIDINKVLYGPDVIRTVNPQRGDMEMLQAVTHVDAVNQQLVGYKDITENEFWVAGHIPGRPLFPGVLMIELAAQLACFYTKYVLKWDGFIGFGACDEVKFRQQVVPGQRLHVLCKHEYSRHRRCACSTQGIINGTLAFEAKIVGTQL